MLQQFPKVEAFGDQYKSIISPPLRNEMSTIGERPMAPIIRPDGVLTAVAYLPAPLSGWAIRVKHAQSLAALRVLSRTWPGPSIAWKGQTRPAADGTRD